MAQLLEFACSPLAIQSAALLRKVGNSLFTSCCRKLVFDFEINRVKRITGGSASVSTEAIGMGVSS